MLCNVLFSRHHPLSCYNHWMMEAETQTCSGSKTEKETEETEVDDSDADYVRIVMKLRNVKGKL